MTVVHYRSLESCLYAAHDASCAPLTACGDLERTETSLLQTVTTTAMSHLVDRILALYAQKPPSKYEKLQHAVLHQLQSFEVSLEKAIALFLTLGITVVFFIYYAELLVRFVPPRLDYFGVLDDIARAAAFGKASAIMGYSSLTGKISCWYLFERKAKSTPDHPFFKFEGKTWTYGQVLQDANRLSRYWLERGVKPEDTVAMMCASHSSIALFGELKSTHSIPNKPTFVTLWLSFMSIGVSPAFINYNLTGDSLKHCINVSGAKVVLFDPDVQEEVRKVQGDFKEHKFMLWVDGMSKTDGKPSDSSWTVVTEDAYKQYDTWTLPHEKRSMVTWKTPIVYIFTSGTSGMPKMAPCSQAKFATAALTWCRFANWSKNDIVYTPLPLYHSSAAFLCIGAAIARGSTVALSRKFSASKFFAEVRENDATIVQYIGELCRYLLSKEASEDDKKHRVHTAYGNGLRPDIWNEFKQRFNIPTITEFYASTEVHCPVSFLSCQRGAHTRTG